MSEESPFALGSILATNPTGATGLKPPGGIVLNGKGFLPPNVVESEVVPAI